MFVLVFAEEIAVDNISFALNYTRQIQDVKKTGLSLKCIESKTLIDTCVNHNSKQLVLGD